MVHVAYKFFRLLFTVEVARTPSLEYCSNIINTVSSKDKTKLGKGKKIKIVTYTPQNRHIELPQMQILPKVCELMSCRMLSKTVNGLLLSYIESWFITQDRKEEIQLIWTHNLLLLLSVLSPHETRVQWIRKRKGTDNSVCVFLLALAFGNQNIEEK